MRLLGLIFNFVDLKQFCILMLNHKNILKYMKRMCRNYIQKKLNSILHSYHNILKHTHREHKHHRNE